ncbi:MAG: tetratricopeptide repeat protein [Bacilli bacterium]|jgi:TPR repeat protein
MDRVYLWEQAPEDEYQRQRLALNAASGDVEAATALGYFYSLGLYDYPRDLKRGRRYFDEGMAKRYPQAYYVYALVLLETEPVDYHKALKFFERSANLGFGRGMAQVGNFFLEGKAVKKSYQLAEEWLVKSRCRDARAGLLFLAKHYEEEGKDLEKAKHLTNLAQSFKFNP